MNLFPLTFVLKKVYVMYYTTVLLYVEQNLDTTPTIFEKLYKYFLMNQMLITTMQHRFCLQPG